jgi:hypothetical protein
VNQLRLEDGWLYFDSARVARIVDGLELGVLRRFEEAIDQIDDLWTYVEELEMDLIERPEESTP